LNVPLGAAKAIVSAVSKLPSPPSPPAEPRTLGNGLPSPASAPGSARRAGPPPKGTDSRYTGLSFLMNGGTGDDSDSDGAGPSTRPGGRAKGAAPRGATAPPPPRPPRRATDTGERPAVARQRARLRATRRAATQGHRLAVHGPVVPHERRHGRRQRQRRRRVV